MTIWILALLMLAAGVGMGLNLGVIRSAFSFVGIVIGTLLAAFTGSLIKPVLPHLGIENNPFPLAWIVAPITGLLIVWVIITAIGFEVHRRVSVYYKYKAGDLRLALWERLNLRLGACVGVLNGTAWLVLISFFIFNLSYLTAQIAPSENEAKMTRLMNRMGQDLQSTGMDKPARAVGSVPSNFYKTANFAGFIVQNPGVTARLGDYPAFLSLGERNDVQQLSQDTSLAEEWKNGAPMGEILNDSQVQTILKNTNLVATVLGIIQSDMDDITNYLVTGQSPKYDSQKIVGRWSFDLVPALAALRQSQPKIKPNEMKELRALWTQAFASTTFVAGTDGQAFLKNVPDFKSHPPQSVTSTGQWSGGDTHYDLSLNGNGQPEQATADTDGLRLTIKLGETTYVFERAY
jgi:Colicin V production protein